MFSRSSALKLSLLVSLSSALLSSFSTAQVAAQSLGNLAQYPPQPMKMTITTSKEGEPVVTPSTLKLNAGRYYRLTFDCPDVRGDLS